MEFIGNTWAEVDVSALLNNFQLLRQRYAAGRKLLSIVKTDAYGHGAAQIASLLQKAGSDGFTVSGLLEAEELRQSGITVPIVILGYTPVCHAELLARQDIHQCVFSLDYARELDAAAAQAGVTVPVHLKLDTGMGRIGFDCRSDAFPGLSDARAVLELKHLRVVGVFMHFATADSFKSCDVDFASEQAQRFWTCVEGLEAAGAQFVYKHCCNSAATLLQEPQGNAIRPGIILYGLAPDGLSLPEGFRPVMSVYSTVSQVKTMEDHESVSYGRTWFSQGQRKIATICAGYGDGVPRLLSSKGHVLIRGKKAPIVGRVCMDHLCVDVTDIPEVSRGDRVTIFGPGLPVEQVAAWADTLHYEILCGMAKRVMRVYKA